MLLFPKLCLFILFGGLLSCQTAPTQTTQEISPLPKTEWPALTSFEQSKSLKNNLNRLEHCWPVGKDVINVLLIRSMSFEKS